VSDSFTQVLGVTRGHRPRNLPKSPKLATLLQHADQESVLWLVDQKSSLSLALACQATLYGDEVAFISVHDTTSSYEDAMQAQMQRVSSPRASIRYGFALSGRQEWSGLVKQCARQGSKYIFVHGVNGLATSFPSDNAVIKGSCEVGACLRRLCADFGCTIIITGKAPSPDAPQVLQVMTVQTEMDIKAGMRVVCTHQGETVLTWKCLPGTTELGDE
jgi:hypothetical protein